MSKTPRKKKAASTTGSTAVGGEVRTDALVYGHGKENKPVIDVNLLLAKSQQRGKTDFDALRKRQEANENDVDTSDIPQLPEEFFSQAVYGVSQPKQVVSLRLEPEVLEYYRAKGSGYLSVMAKVLKQFMLAEQKHKL